MEQSKHEQLVRQISEEMAKIWEAHYVIHQDVDCFKALIEEFIPLAQYTINKMSSYFEDGYRHGPFSILALHDALERRGLIPSPDQPEQ